MAHPGSSLADSRRLPLMFAVGVMVVGAVIRGGILNMDLLSWPILAQGTDRVTTERAARPAAREPDAARVTPERDGAERALAMPDSPESGKHFEHPAVQLQGSPAVVELNTKPRADTERSGGKGSDRTHGFIADLVPDVARGLENDRDWARLDQLGLAQLDLGQLDLGQLDLGLITTVCADQGQAGRALAGDDPGRFWIDRVLERRESLVARAGAPSGYAAPGTRGRVILRGALEPPRIEPLHGTGSPQGAGSPERTGGDATPDGGPAVGRFPPEFRAIFPICVTG